MTPQELKNSILQLAIQGRLVEQRPEEGTAEELYRQIQREKAALVKAGKIKKEKPLPEITEEEMPFEIPEGWKWVRLGGISSCTGGYAFKSHEFSSEGVRVIRISDFNKQGFVDSTIVRHVFSKEYEPYLIEKDSILLCMTGGTVGKSLLVKKQEERMMANQRVATIKPIIVNPEYLYTNIESSIIQSVIQRSKNSTNDNISMETINNFLIPLPPLAEQKRIVAKIEELLPYIDRYEAAWSRLEDFNKRFPTDMQKSILQLAIQGKLVPQRPEEGTGEALYRQIQAEKQSLIRSGKLKKEEPLPDFSDDEIPFDIPESWRWVRFGFFSDIICTGLVRSSKEQYAKADYYYFKMNNIGNFDGKCHFENMNMIFATDEEYKRCRIEKGDFLFNTRNSRELVGKVAVVPAINDRIILNNNILKIHFYGGILPEYMCAFFVSQLGRIQLNQFITNTTNVAAIYQKQLVTLKVPLPPLAEQKRIVAKLEKLLPLCERLK